MSAEGGSILVADDEENVRKLLGAVLRREGYQVALASDGIEALERYRELSPDVALMDIRMPQRDGMDTLRDIHAANPNATVILMTAYASVETAMEAIRQGAFDYIIKPFDLDELQELMQDMLE